MKITILGSGTSSGVPFIGCPCEVCTQRQPKNVRMRSSCLFEVNGKKILIDTTPDLRAQALAFDITAIDAVFYTHTHADHIHGIDELRTFNILMKKPIPVYGNRETIEEITRRFGYIFSPTSYSPGGKPSLIPNIVEDDFMFEGIPVSMIRLKHGRRDNVGYRIGDIAWLTDTNGVYSEGVEKLKGVKVMFLDGLRKTPHESHFHLEGALEESKRIGAAKTVLIHLTHDYDHDRDNPQLPKGVELGYDGMTVTL